MEEEIQDEKNEKEKQLPEEKDFETWTSEDVVKWLKTIKITNEEILKNIKDEHIQGDILFGLTENDLKDLGFKIGHKKYFEKGLEELKKFKKEENKDNEKKNEEDNKKNKDEEDKEKNKDEKDKKKKNEEDNKEKKKDEEEKKRKREENNKSKNKKIKFNLEPRFRYNIYNGTNTEHNQTEDFILCRNCHTLHLFKNQTNCPVFQMNFKKKIIEDYYICICCSNLVENKGGCKECVDFVNKLKIESENNIDNEVKSIIKETNFILKGCKDCNLLHFDECISLDEKEKKKTYIKNNNIITKELFKYLNKLEI
jgi:hypothetical protein